MSGAVSGDIRRLIRQLNSKIAAEEFYDAHQLVRALFERFAKKDDLEGAIEFAEKYAEIFATHEQFELCINLGSRVLSLMKKIGQPPTQDTVSKLTLLFVMCPPYSTDIKYELPNDLSIWLESFRTKSGSANSGQSPKSASQGNDTEINNMIVDIHSIMADAYLAEEKYGACQNHLVFCDDVERLTSLIVKWEKSGYASETYFYALRLTFILLHQQKVELAGEFIRDYAKATKLDMERAECPPPIQLAYLTWAACQYNCLELYELLGRKYVLILRMDDCIARLYQLLESRVFKIKRQEPSLMGMLSQMMGSMKGGNLPQLPVQ